MDTVQIIYHKLVSITRLQFDVSDSNIIVEEGDLLGWTNTEDFLPLSLDWEFGRNIYIRDLGIDDNGTVILPRVDVGVYLFEDSPLGAVMSAGVNLVEAREYNQIGLLFVDLHNGTITVEGYNGKEVNIGSDIYMFKFRLGWLNYWKVLT